MTNLEKIIRKGFMDGENFSQGRRRIGVKWHEIFGFSHDPFSQDLESKVNFNEILNFDKTLIRNLSTLIGGARYAENSYHVAIIGPSGSGKSTILSILNKTAIKNGIEIEFLDLENENDNQINIQEINNPKITCLLCDDVRPNDLVEIVQIRKNHPGLLIASIQTGQYFTVDKSDLNFDQIYFLNEARNDQIVDALKKRVMIASGDDNILPESFFNYIAKLCLSNWKVSIMMAQEWGEVLFSDVSVLTQSDVEAESSMKNFFESYSEYLAYNQGEVRELYGILKTLTSKELTVLTAIINRTISEKDEFSPDDLMDDISGSKSLVYRYLQRLVDHKVVFERVKGRKKFYSVSLLRKVIIENYLQSLLRGERR